MRIGWAIGAVILSLAAGASQAFDTVKTTKIGMSGHVLSMTSVSVELQQTNLAALRKEIPVNQILTIYYDEDPKELKAAKDHVLEGRYQEAQAAMGRIKKEPGRQEVLQDIEFYKALCAAKLALAGNGRIADSDEGPGAGRLMKAFADTNPNSYHYFEASEMVGDLLVAVRQYAQAAEYYGRLAKAPWPDYQMRAGVAVRPGPAGPGKDRGGPGRLRQGDAPPRPTASWPRRNACWPPWERRTPWWPRRSPTTRSRLTDEVLRKADPEDASLMARAYNIAGHGPSAGGPRPRGPAGISARRGALFLGARRPCRSPGQPGRPVGAGPQDRTGQQRPANPRKAVPAIALGRRRRSSTLTPSGGTSCGPPSAASDRRACRSAWWRCWRGRASPAPGEDRRRRPTGAWRSCAATCAG